LPVTLGSGRRPRPAHEASESARGLPVPVTTRAGLTGSGASAHWQCEPRPPAARERAPRELEDPSRAGPASVSRKLSRCQTRTQARSRCQCPQGTRRSRAVGVLSSPIIMIRIAFSVASRACQWWMNSRCDRLRAFTQWYPRGSLSSNFAVALAAGNLNTSCRSGTLIFKDGN
jgi:hypothetical protein